MGLRLEKGAHVAIIPNPAEGWGGALASSLARMGCRCLLYALALSLQRELSCDATLLISKLDNQEIKGQFGRHTTPLERCVYA